MVQQMTVNLFASDDDCWNEFHDAIDDLSGISTEEFIGRIVNAIDLLKRKGLVDDNKIENCKLFARTNFHQVHGF